MEQDATVPEQEIDEATRAKEQAKSAKRAERLELRERNQEILVENTHVLFENLTKYLQGELKGRWTKNLPFSPQSHKWRLSPPSTNERSNKRQVCGDGRCSNRPYQKHGSNTTEVYGHLCHFVTLQTKNFSLLSSK